MENLEIKAKNYRLNSVSDNTKKSRMTQWRCYLNACKDFNWRPIPCDVQQACLYVASLADRLKFSSITTYYQSVIFFHVCAGAEPVRMSNPILRATLRGIERSLGQVQKGKDPILPSHLKELVKVVDVEDDLELLVFVAALLMFRSLLRVSHVVFSQHTLRVRDVKFVKDYVTLLIHSSKTKSLGEPDVIPITKSKDRSICAYHWLHYMLHKLRRKKNCYLFSTDAISSLTYSAFSKMFKTLLVRAGIHGDFASHSLRRGGATFMSMLDCPVTQIKARGRWKSECVYRYIKPPLKSKVEADKKVSGYC